MVSFPLRLSRTLSLIGVLAALICALAIAASLPGASGRSAATSAKSLLPDPSVDEPLAARPGGETMVVAGGCFWGVQAVFASVRGVVSSTSGYAGGTKQTADYETVSTGRTGHAESVRVIFDPSKISYGQLLRVFFSVAHDPTQLNQQGPDVGTQYRSAIFYHSPEQKKAAEDTIARLTAEHRFPKPIVTQVVPADTFWRAEEYHQKYLEKRGMVSCHI